jgi:hypothetical protein
LPIETLVMRPTDELKVGLVVLAAAIADRDSMMDLELAAARSVCGIDALVAVACAYLVADVAPLADAGGLAGRVGASAFGVARSCAGVTG